MSTRPNIDANLQDGTFARKYHDADGANVPELPRSDASGPITLTEVEASDIAFYGEIQGEDEGA